MIVGLGNDIINIERIAKQDKFMQHFAHKILGKKEIKDIEKQNFSSYKLACYLAKHFAAKEAFVKALGTGFQKGIFLKDIQILHNNLGKPFLEISNTAREYLQNIAPKNKLHITISDDYPYASAVVIIENETI